MDAEEVCVEGLGVGGGGVEGGAGDDEDCRVDEEGECEEGDYRAWARMVSWVFFGWGAMGWGGGFSAPETTGRGDSLDLTYGLAR